MTSNKIIKLDSRPVKESKQNYHWIPCEVDYTGAANVNSFFDSIVRAEEEKDQQQYKETKNQGGDADNSKTERVIGSFRGRPLKGMRIQLPDDFCGLTLKTSQLNEDKPTLVACEKFKQLIHWNWDQESTVNDPEREALQWLHVSERLHENVTKAQVETFFQQNPPKKN